MARNSDVRSDNAKNLDFSIFKDFRFRERYRFSLRGEAFNLMYTPLFGAPNTVLDRPRSGAFSRRRTCPGKCSWGSSCYFRSPSWQICRRNKL